MAGMGMGGYTQMLKGAGTTAQGVQTGAMGAIELMQAHKLKKEAASAMPGFYDPQQMSFLSELNQKRRSLDTGSGYAAGMNAIGATTAGTDNGILSAGGGNVGGTMQALLSAQRNAGDAQNQVLANGEQQNMKYNSMYGELLDKVAGRKYQLQMQKHSELMAQWAQQHKAGMSNLMAGMASTFNSLNHEKDQPPDQDGVQPTGASGGSFGGFSPKGSGAQMNTDAQTNSPATGAMGNAQGMQTEGGGAGTNIGAFTQNLA
jgi:hypothetical protein